MSIVASCVVCIVMVVVMMVVVIVIMMVIDVVVMARMAGDGVAGCPTEGKVFSARRHGVPPHPRAFAWHHPRPDFFRDRSFLRET